MKSIKVFLISLFSVCCASSMAQNYPTKAVRVIVPFAAGGGIDMVARVISQRLQEVMGQPFVVENKPGAGGVVGSEIVATARPDGYTLLAVPISHAANVSLTKMSFNPVTAFAVTALDPENLTEIGPVKPVALKRTVSPIRPALTSAVIFGSIIAILFTSVVVAALAEGNGVINALPGRAIVRETNNATIRLRLITISPLITISTMREDLISEA